MYYAKEQVLARVNAPVVARFLALSAIGILLPFYVHIQWATGPIVNAILILLLFLVGVRSALVMCLVPSLMALAGGLLPAVLAPVVPFIMISNVILVLSVEWFYKNIKSTQKGYWLGIFIGALLKFLFLFASVTFISRLLIKQELAVKVAQMMSWPQFATALIGGMIAWGLLKWLKRI